MINKGGSFSPKDVPIHSQVRKIKQESEKIIDLTPGQPEMRPALKEISRHISRSPLGVSGQPISVGESQDPNMGWKGSCWISCVEDVWRLQREDLACFPCFSLFSSVFLSENIQLFSYMIPFSFFFFFLFVNSNSNSNRNNSIIIVYMGFVFLFYLLGF